MVRKGNSFADLLFEGWLIFPFIIKHLVLMRSDFS